MKGGRVMTASPETLHPDSRVKDPSDFEITRRNGGQSSGGGP